MLFNPFSTAQIKKLDFWDANNYRTFKDNQLENHQWKVYQPDTIRRLLESSLKNVWAKGMFTFTVLEILLSEGRSVLWPAHMGTGIDRVKFSVKNQENVGNLLKLLEKRLTYNLIRFWIVFFFIILFNPFSTKKIENTNFGDASNYTNLKYQ